MYKLSILCRVWPSGSNLIWTWFEFGYRFCALDPCCSINSLRTQYLSLWETMKVLIQNVVFWNHWKWYFDLSKGGIQRTRRKSHWKGSWWVGLSWVFSFYLIIFFFGLPNYWLFLLFGITHRPRLWNLANLVQISKLWGLIWYPTHTLSPLGLATKWS